MLINRISKRVSMGRVDAVASTNTSPAARLAIRHESAPLDGNSATHAIAASTPRIAAAAGRLLSSGSG
jgi:hypothetical protein